MAVRRLLLRIEAACVAVVALVLLGIGALLYAGFFVLDARQDDVLERLAAWVHQSRNAENHYLLGLVYVSMDSLVQARLSLQQAVTLDPSHESALEALRAVEAQLNRPDIEE